MEENKAADAGKVVDAGAENANDSPEVREWKKKWKAFANAGGAEPPDHPEANHPFNTDR